MSIRTTILDDLPAHLRRSGRQSVCHDVVVLAIVQSPKYIKIEADTDDDLQKFYKSMIQYRTRHKAAVTIDMRKHRDALFIWIPESGANAG